MLGSTGEQEGRAPEGFSIGVEYTAEDFDKALRMPEERRREIVAVDDRVLGHGTAVAGVAAGEWKRLCQSAESRHSYRK